MLEYLLQQPEDAPEFASIIHQIVAEAQEGQHPGVIARMASGWAVLGEYQPFHGTCMLLTDPIVGSLDELRGLERLRFFEDMTMLGEAIQNATGAQRVSFALLGDSAPAVHAHLFPRFEDESELTRCLPPLACYGPDTPIFDPAEHGELVGKLRERIGEIDSTLDHFQKLSEEHQRAVGSAA